MVDRSSDLPFEVVQARLADFSQTEGRVADEGYRVVHVRGQRMRTTTELFAEFAAAFQFPWYFGQNWAAFDECMTDLDDWLPPGPQGYAVSVWHADATLAKDKAALAVLIDRLEFIRQESAEPSGLVSTGSGVTSPTPRGFRVVLHCESDAHRRLVDRWTRAGARLDTSAPPPRRRNPFRW